MRADEGIGPYRVHRIFYIVRIAAVLVKWEPAIYNEKRFEVIFWRYGTNGYFCSIWMVRSI